MPSCIIFTQALRAGSSNCVLDGSLDGDVSFTNFMNEYHVLNVAQCVVNSSTLMHAAIQVVYCHYMLTPFMECLWYVKL